jgi:ribosomal-protein-alanine N-acetyltransferase
MSTFNQHTYFPALETERLFLRNLVFEDTDFVFRHFSDPAVTQYLMDQPPLAEYEEAQEIIRFYQEPEAKKRNRWGLVRKADNQLIGTCGYHNWRQRDCHAEMGYDLSPTCWGQGFMTEALRVVIPSGFERMGLNRIEALVYTGNTRSVQLLYKLGFKSEGTLRDYYYLNAMFHDHYLLSLLRREWKG